MLLAGASIESLSYVLMISRQDATAETGEGIQGCPSQPFRVTNSLLTVFVFLLLSNYGRGQIEEQC
jgi:hypothetical protein